MQQTTNSNVVYQFMSKIHTQSDYRCQTAYADRMLKLRELKIKEVYVWDEKEAESVVILKNDLEESFKSQVRDILEKHTYWFPMLNLFCISIASFRAMYWIQNKSIIIFI